MIKLNCTQDEFIRLFCRAARSIISNGYLLRKGTSEEIDKIIEKQIRKTLFEITSEETTQNINIVSSTNHDFLNEIKNITDNAKDKNQTQLFNDSIAIIRSGIKKEAEKGENKYFYDMSSNALIFKDKLIEEVTQMGFMCIYQHEDEDVHESMSYEIDRLIIEW